MNTDHFPETMFGLGEAVIGIVSEIEREKEPLKDIDNNT